MMNGFRHSRIIIGSCGKDISRDVAALPQLMCSSIKEEMCQFCKIQRAVGISVNSLFCRHKPIRSMPHAIQLSGISSTRPKIEGLKLNFLNSVELCFAFRHELAIGECLV